MNDGAGSKVTEAIIGAAMEVHKTLGPGLLESAYEGCLAWELRDRGHNVEQQTSLPMSYKGYQLDMGYRLDLILDDLAIEELKAVERLEPIRQAQLLSYLKLSGKKAGLLMNFNVSLLSAGIKRLVT